MIEAGVPLEPLDWAEIGEQLDRQGHAVLPGLLDAAQAQALAAQLDAADTLGGQARQRDAAAPQLTPGLEPAHPGLGDTCPAARPLPELLHQMLTLLYEHLVPVANRWNEALDIPVRYPHDLHAFSALCRSAGQSGPHASLVRLGEHAYQALHRNDEGPAVFPLQAVALLSEPQRDFTGGEFVITEQRPRMQSRPVVLLLGLGDLAIIATSNRPLLGSKGWYRARLQHGISRVRSGERLGLELLFHGLTRTGCSRRE